MSTRTKLTARMPQAWPVRNCFQVGPLRRGHGIDPGVMQDLPDRGRCDWVTEPDQLALHPPVPPRGIIGRDADHQLADRSCRGRPPGKPAAGVVPLAYGQPPVPGEQRRRCHREHLAPQAAWNQSRQCCQPQPVTRLVADPADLTAQDRPAAGTAGCGRRRIPGGTQMTFPSTHSRISASTCRISAESLVFPGQHQTRTGIPSRGDRHPDDDLRRRGLRDPIRAMG